MKTTIKSGTIVIVTMLIALNTYGQRTTRGDSRNSQREYKKTDKTIAVHNNSSRKGTNDKKKYSFEQHKNSSQQNNMHQNRDYARNSMKHHDRYPSYESKFHNKGFKERPNHHSDIVYYKGLPHGKASRFHHNGCDFYSCNNKFYRFHPQFGYYVVDAPFTLVHYLPTTYYIKVSGGNHFIYSNGFYYIPMETGFMRVPENNCNNVSFNFSFLIGR